MSDCYSCSALIFSCALTIPVTFCVGDTIFVIILLHFLSFSLKLLESNSIMESKKRLSNRSELAALSVFPHSQDPLPQPPGFLNQEQGEITVTIGVVPKRYTSARDSIRSSASIQEKSHPVFKSTHFDTTSADRFRDRFEEQHGLPVGLTIVYAILVASFLMYCAGC